MVSLVLFSLVFAASYVFSEPIPMVHDRLIRRCDNHTSNSRPPYGSPTGQNGFPSGTLAVLSTITASNSSSNATTANAFGTSTTAVSASTTLPANISFLTSTISSSPLTTQNASWGIVTVTSTIFPTSSTACVGSLCPYAPVGWNSSVAVGPTTTWYFTSSAAASGSNQTEFASSTVTIINSTTLLNSASTLGSVTHPSSSLVSAENTSALSSLSHATNISTAATLLSTSSIENSTLSRPTETQVGSNATAPTPLVTSSSCSRYSYGCLPPFVNSSAVSSQFGATTAGPIGTSNSSALTIVIINSTTFSTGPTTTTVFVTASGISGTSIANKTWTTSSNSTNTSQTSLSYGGYSFNSGPLLTTAPATVPVAATSPASTDLSPFNQSEALTPALPSTTATSGYDGWSPWIGPSITGSLGSPQTMSSSTSFISLNGTATSPTSSLNGTSSIESLPSIEVAVEQLAGDSVGLIEKINSLLANAGFRKRGAKPAIGGRRLGFLKAN